jgi:hypothetical protein
MLYVFFWVIPQLLNFIYQRFGTLCLFHLYTYPPIKMEYTECSETSAYKIQTPRNCPKKVYNICHVNFRSEFAKSRFAAIFHTKSSVGNSSDQVLQVFNYEQQNCWLIMLADQQVSKLLWQRCGHLHADSLHNNKFKLHVNLCVVRLSLRVCYS